VVQRVIDALKEEGFGILTDIEVSDTLRKKISVDFPGYQILGACNPRLAYEALQLESRIRTMMPCDVVIRDDGDGKVEIAAIDPVASMGAIDNPSLKQAADQARKKLRRVVATV
jgi:uncharacterized protein (DUF302 family)